MSTTRFALACVITGTVLSPACVHGPQPAPKENIMTTRASGPFDVKVSPLPPDTAEQPPFGRLFLDKQYQGDLQGEGKGQMLATDVSASGSGAYVALERVNGTLRGRKGSFVLQHSGTMSGGAAHMTITVVPESGTQELAGLTGKLTIHVVDGKHSYDLDYTLP